MKPIDPTLATEAIGLVTGPRQAAYAHPQVNFSRIAALWSPILGVEVTPEQVGLCMVQVKIARQLHAHSRDSVVDAVGYLLCTEACREED